MSYLIRTEVGDFSINDSYSIDYIQELSMENINSIIRPIDESLSFMDSIVIEDKYFKNIINGLMLPINNRDYIDVDSKIYKVYCKNIFIGLGKIINKDGQLYIKMDKVLI